MFISSFKFLGKFIVPFLKLFNFIRFDISIYSYVLLLFFFSFLKFCWSIVDLQYWSDFCCTIKWLGYTYICSLSDSLPTEYWVEFSVLYSRFLLAHHSIFSVCICQSQTPGPSLPLPELSPLVTIHLSSKSVNWFLFCRWVHLYPIFRFHI